MAPHIGIVGAGVSGLRCAAVLLEQSYDVTIIEARNRVGGRVRHGLIPSLVHSLTLSRLPRVIKWDLWKSTCEYPRYRIILRLMRTPKRSELGA